MGGEGWLETLDLKRLGLDLKVGVRDLGFRIVCHLSFLICCGSFVVCLLFFGGDLFDVCRLFLAGGGSAPAVKDQRDE